MADKHLFDDVVGSGWCIVAKPGVLDALPTDYREAWKAFRRTNRDRVRGRKAWCP